MNENRTKNIASESKSVPKAGNPALPFLMLAIGVAALAATVWQVGPAAILHAFEAIDGVEYLVFLFYPFISIWDAWGWRYVFPPAWRNLGIRSLFLVRLAGEAMNNLTPFFDLGGEPLKASLLYRRFGVPKAVAVSATIAAKSFLFFSEVAFWICGLAPALLVSSTASEWKWALSVFCVAAAGCGYLLFMLQKRGFFAVCMRLSKRLTPNAHWIERVREPLEAVDASVKQVYRGSPLPPAAAFALHFIGWAAGGVETYFMFHVLGAPVSMVEAVTLEALLQLTRTASCFVPSSLGVQEAGMALYAGWFGATAPIGVAVSLLKRARQLLWNAAGLAVWGFYEWRIRKAR